MVLDQMVLDEMGHGRIGIGPNGFGLVRAFYIPFIVSAFLCIYTFSIVFIRPDFGFPIISVACFFSLLVSGMAGDPNHDLIGGCSYIVFTIYLMLLICTYCILLMIRIPSHLWHMFLFDRTFRHGWGSESCPVGGCFSFIIYSIMLLYCKSLSVLIFLL